MPLQISQNFESYRINEASEPFLKIPVLYVYEEPILITTRMKGLHREKTYLFYY
jgi:hypothetical protein